MVRGNFGWSYAGWLGFFNNEVLMKGNYMKAIRAALLFGALLFNVSAFALEIKPYSADTFSQLQKSGAKVALHFHAEWCPTCKAQEKVFASWKGDISVPGTLTNCNMHKSVSSRISCLIRFCACCNSLRHSWYRVFKY